MHIGPLTLGHWLSWRLGLEAGSAREQVRVARRLADLPAIDEELRHARITYSQARAITRVATADNEAKLIEVAKHSTAAQLERIVRGVRQIDAETGRPQIAHVPERWVRDRAMPDGSVRIEAQLGPDEAALVMEALRTMCATMRAEQSEKDAAPAPTFADALVRIADRVEAREDVAVTRTGGDRTSLILHLGPDVLAARDDLEEASPSRLDDRRVEELTSTAVDRDVTEPWAARLDDGSRVSAETFRRLACDCALLPVREDAQGDPLDVGRKTRKIPTALRRAIMARDRGCAFPGCTHDRFVDCHHVEHWIDGGETSRRNLMCLCTFHHRLVHEGGFSIAHDADGVIEFRAPNGKGLPRLHRPWIEGEDDLVEQLRLRHADLGLDDETAYPQWDGRAADYSACVEMLCSSDLEVLETPDEVELVVNVLPGPCRDVAAITQ